MSIDGKLGVYLASRIDEPKSIFLSWTELKFADRCVRLTIKAGLVAWIGHFSIDEQIVCWWRLETF
jgi:hypothetical protein